MNRRTVVVVVTLLALAGCGGGEPQTARSTSSPAAPTVYTPAQLRAALPGVGDVPGGDSVQLRCPQDKDQCSGGTDDTETWTIGFGVTRPDKPSAAEEEEQMQAVPKNFAAVNVSLFRGDADARKQAAASRKSAEEYDGDFDIDDETLENGSTVPGQRGTGTIDDITLGMWAGHVASRRLASTVTAEAEPSGVQVTQLNVTSGRVAVSAFVSITSGERTPDASDRLARGLVRDYLRRLG